MGYKTESLHVYLEYERCSGNPAGSNYPMGIAREIQA